MGTCTENHLPYSLPGTLSSVCLPWPLSLQPHDLQNAQSKPVHSRKLHNPSRKTTSLLEHVKDRSPFNHMEIKPCTTCLVCASLQRDVPVKCSWVHKPEFVLTKLQGAPQKGKWLPKLTRSAKEWHELLSPPIELQPGTSTQ